MLDASGAQHLLLAETLGLAMARRASDILDRHRAALAGGEAARDDDDAQFALDNAIFTAVLDAANECLGRFDARPADDRWCDALLQVLNLAGLAELSRLPPRARPRLRAAEPGLTGSEIYYYYHRKYSKPGELPRAEAHRGDPGAPGVPLARPAGQGGEAGSRYHY